MNLICRYCGTQHPNAIIEYISETETRVICPNCYSLFNTCAACQNCHCAFNDYQGPLPPYVMQTIRHGNMVAQQQVPNPEVVKITCMAGCDCYDTDEHICHHHEHQICRNYLEVE